MSVDQHLKVAQWHIEKARKHAESSDFSCGCPINDDFKKEIAEIEEKLEQ